MSDYVQLVVAMADHCQEVINAWNHEGLDQPRSLRPNHLRWMCREIATHAGDWPAIKVHRWIGFVQGAMIANHMLSLTSAKRMFDAAKNAFGDTGLDLADHIDPDNDFKLDLGGQG